MQRKIPIHSLAIDAVAAAGDKQTFTYACYALATLTRHTVAALTRHTVAVLVQEVLERVLEVFRNLILALALQEHEDERPEHQIADHEHQQRQQLACAAMATR